MKKLSMKVLDQNVLDKNEIFIHTNLLENYFDKKDGEAYGLFSILDKDTGMLHKTIYLARRKYIPRVTKFLQSKGISNPIIMSREEANKTIAKQYAIKFEVNEVADE